MARTKRTWCSLALLTYSSKFLPKERMVATGDLLVNGTSYLGDAFIPEWIDTIQALKQLDLGTVLPGHGSAFTDMAKCHTGAVFWHHLADSIAGIASQQCSCHRAGPRGFSESVRSFSNKDGV